MSEETGFMSMAGAKAEGAAPEIGFGMLGYAFMGKAHSNALKKIPYMMYPPVAIPKLVAIAGRNEAATAEAARRYGYQRYYTDWHKLVEDPEVQVLDNGTPNDAHAEPSILAAQLGKHVFAAAQPLDAIPYSPVAVVASAYRRADVQHALDGFGFLSPRKEKRAILGTLFSSSMFDGRVPDDPVLLTSFVGGARDPALARATPDEIVTAVERELAALLGAASPPWREVVQWPRAIPQYTLGHLGPIATLEQAEAAVPGLFFRSNYRGGVSVGDCIKSADAGAAAVASYLAR